MIRSLLLALLVPALFAACAATPTIYGPAASSTAAGWRDTRIEPDRFRVTFRANSDLKAPQVEDLALRRAAEIATQNGADWFRVVNRFTDQIGGSRGGGTSVGVGGSTGSYGSGVGVGVAIDLTPDRRQYESTLEVLLGRGEKPTDASVYSARDLLARVSPLEK
jgi:hypothetical protein